MHVRRYDPDADYPLFVHWMKGYGLEPLPAVALPKIGFVVVNGGVDVAMAFLYQTDSALCHIEWVVRDPKAPVAIARGAVEFCVNSLCSFAASLGYRLAFMSTRHKALINKLTSRAGFEIMEDSSMTNLLRKLEKEPAHV